MSSGGVGDLFRALVPIGTVTAVRQEYEVFRTSGGDYVVFSPSSRGSSSYHMTLVHAPKVEAVDRVVGKQGATTGSLMKEAKLEGAFGPRNDVASRFDVLMCLYVLTALGKLDMKKEGRNLLFVRKDKA